MFAPGRLLLPPSVFISRKCLRCSNESAIGSSGGMCNCFQLQCTTTLRTTTFDIEMIGKWFRRQRRSIDSQMISYSLSDFFSNGGRKPIIEQVNHTRLTALIGDHSTDQLKGLSHFFPSCTSECCKEFEWDAVERTDTGVKNHSRIRWKCCNIFMFNVQCPTKEKRAW